MNNKSDYNSPFGMQWELDRCDDEMHRPNDHHPHHPNTCPSYPSKHTCNCKQYADHRIAEALRTIVFVQDKTKPDVYTLMVAGRPSGSVTVTEPPFITDLKWSAQDKRLSIVFGGQSFDVTLDGIEGQTYVAGEGISIVDGVINSTIDTTDFIKKDEAKNFVQYMQVSPDRKAIVLEYGDAVLGTDNDGNLFNVIHLNKDKNVTLGNQSCHANIASSDRPTINSNEEVAYLSDVNYVREQIEKFGPVEDLVTEKELTETLASYVSNEGMDLKLSNYVKNEQIEEKLACYATTESVIQQIEEYTKDAVTEAVIDSKLENYVNKEEFSNLDEKFQPIGNYATKDEIPSVAGLASEEYVDGKVEEVEGKIPSLEGIATENWVEEQGYLKEHQDISGLATKAEISDMATKSYVGEEIEKIQIPSIDGLVKEEEIADMLTKTEAEQEYQKKDDYALKSDIPSIESYFDGVEYVKNDNKIYFKHGDENKAYIDTTDFVKDGMISDVAIVDGFLVITFNTDAGKDEIKISIDKIFNAENYLTKQEIEEKYVPWGEYQGRKIISLNDRDAISGKIADTTSKFGGEGANLLMLSSYSGLDFAVTEVGSAKTALVLNTIEDVVKVEVNENGKRVQHSVATDEDLNKLKENLAETYQEKGDYPVYERYDNDEQNIHKKTITLENNDNISGKRTDGIAVNLIELSKWNVVDIGSKSAPAINLNSGYERPLYNDTHGIALLDDINALEDKLIKRFDLILKNYAIKDDAALANMIKAGGDVILVSDVKSEKGYTLTKAADIDLNGHSLDAVSNGNYGDNIVIGNGAAVTISNGEIKPAENASVANASATIIVKTASESHLTLNNVKVTGIHPVYLNSTNENSSVIINGGEYFTTMPLEGVSSDNMAPAIYVGKGSTGSVTGGKVTINGGTFGQKGVVNNFLLNIEDVLRKQEGKEPRNFIEVFGGKYWNFDPSNNKAEGENTNFVADGYIVKKTQEGEDTLYEVVKE